MKEAATAIDTVFVECLESAVCNCGRDGRVTCGCGRVHGFGEDEHGESGEHQSYGEFCGSTYVYGCRCEPFLRFANVIYNNKKIILRALARFARTLETDAKKMAKDCDAALDAALKGVKK